MQQKRWLILVAWCLLVAAVAFALGRWSGSAKHPSTTGTVCDVPEAHSLEMGSHAVEAEDFSRVAIENLGQVEFDQAYELIHSAPKEALTMWSKRLEGLRVGPRRTAGITAFFKTLAQVDAKTAVDLALSLQRQEPRWTAIGAVSNATPAINLNEVARMDVALNEKRLALTDLVINWSRSDPAATAQFISSYAGDVEKSDVALLVTNWAALNPMAAREWLASAGAARQGPEVNAGFYAGWIESDRAAALNDLAARAGDETFDKAFEVVAKELFKDSPDAVRAFVLTLPNGATQELVVNGITADVTAIYMIGGPDFKADEIAKWLITLPENLWQKQLGYVLNRWPDEGREARDAWLDQLPPNVRDVALADFCRAYNSNVPTDNIRAGLKINDPQLRQATFRNIFRDMDGEVRQELLANAQLSATEAQELKKILKRL